VRIRTQTGDDAYKKAVTPAQPGGQAVTALHI
jgi:hypothetical protein